MDVVLLDFDHDDYWKYDSLRRNFQSQTPFFYVISNHNYDRVEFDKTASTIKFWFQTLNSEWIWDDEIGDFIFISEITEFYYAYTIDFENNRITAFEYVFICNIESTAQLRASINFGYDFQRSVPANIRSALMW